MSTRRDFLRAGGALLVGLAAPLPLARFGRGAASMKAPPPVEPVEIRMRSDPRGARVGFDPVGLRISPGTTVRWVLEANAHSTTAYHPHNGGFAARIPPGAEPWDSGILTEPGQTFHHQFLDPGVYDYFCLPHELAGMAGRILVVPDPETVRYLREPDAVDGKAPSPAARSALPPIELVLRHGIVHHPLHDKEVSR